jgi:hypothetical protein
MGLDSILGMLLVFYLRRIGKELTEKQMFLGQVRIWQGVGADVGSVHAFGSGRPKISGHSLEDVLEVR